MSLSYLDTLDDVLGSARVGLSAAFVDSQRRFVLSCQQADGGFTGRRGPSDPYYTDFAVRTLSLLAPRHTALLEAEAYLQRLAVPPTGIVECFNRLNIARLTHASTVLDQPGLAGVILDHAVATGGFARFPGLPGVSAYHTFLGALSFQMMQLDLPQADAGAQAIATLRRTPGGYADLPEQSHAQTNATAAAVAFLSMQNTLDENDGAQTADFLVSLQSPMGGLLAHGSAPGPDLLSTFTGMLTLLGLGALDRLNLPLIARFLRSCATPSGGFRASPRGRSGGFGIHVLCRGNAAAASARIREAIPAEPGRHDCGGSA